MEKQLYVCGFLFDHDGKKVCLIKKTDKHDLKWMHGKLNGVGGKVLPNEQPEEAMRREFLEETGADVWGWIPFCTLEFQNAKIIFYKIFSGSIDDVKTMTDEQVEVHGASLIISAGYNDMVANLRWLLPLALDKEVSSAIINGKINQ